MKQISQHFLKRQYRVMIIALYFITFLPIVFLSFKAMGFMKLNPLVDISSTLFSLFGLLYLLQHRDKKEFQKLTPTLQHTLALFFLMYITILVVFGVYEFVFIWYYTAIFAIYVISGNKMGILYGILTTLLLAVLLVFSFIDATHGGIILIASFVVFNVMSYVNNLTIQDGLKEIHYKNIELSKLYDEQLKIVADLKESNITLEKIATIDTLTGISNRFSFELLFDKLYQDSKRYELSVAFAFVDLDRFKSINDDYGHDVGDSVLREFGQLLKKSLRTTDILARWGGEEFVIAMPNTNLEQAKNVMEKIREEVAKYDFKFGRVVTLSAGISLAKLDDTKEEIIKRADEALYDAKNSGRNRVCVG